MASHKLPIACVVTLAMLGFGRHVEAASLTLAWNHSTSSNAAGYQVSYGTQSGKYTANVKAGYVTSIAINGLTEGTTYYFIVQSYDGAGALGSPSPEISGKVPAAVPALSISCPSPVLTSPDGNSISVTLTPTISGGVAPVSTSCSPASGAKFSVGTTSFSCTAVDAAQQKASCTSTVVVLAPSQPAPTPEPAPEPMPEPAPVPTPTVQPPPVLVTLVCPTIAPVKESGQSGKAVVEFGDPVFNDGTAPVTVSCSPKSGSQFRIGTTTVSCSATNAAREPFACTTTVTVTDRPKLSNGG
jgi:fibronectin type III domain protein/HYR domain-containing protein